MRHRHRRHPHVPLRGVHRAAPAASYCLCLACIRIRLGRLDVMIADIIRRERSAHQARQETIRHAMTAGGDALLGRYGR